MPERFAPNLDILPESQKTLWAELKGTPDDFVLYGGTALALRLGHRTSVDFDFFSNRPFDPEALYAAIPYLHGAVVQQMAPNTLTCSVDRGGPVQVSFFGGLALNRVADPDEADGAGIAVASLLDVGAAKAKVVVARPSWKDYVDMDAILEAGEPLARVLCAAVALYGPPYSPLLTLKALTFFDDLGEEVREDVRARLRAAVAGVRPEELGALPVSVGVKEAAA
ncbi:nucleotidyl transferase AbiEii/AbiGii toxin family protein [Nitratidesulfovibrio sp. 1201_IL3209]|uniref:nucleotidyl transferase AbiEii/AbiGii toxin family protein n=1 Tax=Nitratidesulfovibrio sp. 1201_IL3209 TaxID=3084053 RepID=UPI002FDA87C9